MIVQFLLLYATSHILSHFNYMSYKTEKLLNSCNNKLEEKKNPNNSTSFTHFPGSKKNKPYKDFYLLSNQNFQLNLFSNFNHRMHKYQHA